jgi:hypothetical protein
MWRLSFSGVCELRNSFKPRFDVQRCKCGWSKDQKLRTALFWMRSMSESHRWTVVSISQKSEKRRLYSLLYDLIISNPGLKATTSNASPGWTILLLGMMTKGFWKRELIPIDWYQCRSWTSQLYFCLHIYSICSGAHFNVYDASEIGLMPCDINY